MEELLKWVELVNEQIHSIVWGPIMLALLLGTGVYLTIRLGFPQIVKFGFIAKSTIGTLFSSSKHHQKDESGVSPFQAVATAMAGTIGTGSITGIATAITMGGPGAVFWMWVSAIFGMVTKYSEILLAIHFREKNSKGQWVGGPMYYIEKGLHLKWLAVAFAFFAAMTCLGTGNMTQANSISVALESVIGVPRIITGIILAIIVGAVILGGIKRIASVNERLVPFMAVFYVICAVLTLALNWELVPHAFALIFEEAFNFEAALGGTAGYGIVLAMRYGFARGVFSNEAGLGSAPIAHAASSTKSPVEQGLWGMFEVFFTTIIICTLSALVILTSGLWENSNLEGSALSIAAYNQALPYFGGIGVTLATIFFATSTIFGWAYYGEKSIEYLCHSNQTVVMIYRVVYVLFVIVGAVGNLSLIWGISDTMNGLMAIPNLIGVFGLSGVVFKLSREYFASLRQQKEV